MGKRTLERRAEVERVISHGEWSGPRAAELAAQFNCTVQTINNDRRRLQGIRGVGSRPRTEKPANLHTLPAPPKPPKAPEPPASAGVLLAGCSRVEAFEWLLNCVGDAVQNGDPASGAFVAAAKECRALINELHTVREAEKATRATGTPDKIAAEMGEKLKRLPAPVRKRLAAALAAG